MNGQLKKVSKRVNQMSCVVATTRQMSNSSTSNKSLRQISSGEHKLCNVIITNKILTGCDT